MLVEHPIELDLPNHGGRLAELIATTTYVASSTVKELAKIALTVVIYVGIMTAFAALDIWIWVPYSHQ